MVQKLRVSVSATTTASPALVWARLADAPRWAEWSSFTSSKLLERSAAPAHPRTNPEGNGVGALREFRSGRTVSVERVVAFEAERHLGYTLVSGLPLRHYRADVRLEPRPDGGTTITWQSRFDAKLAGTAPLFAFALRRFIVRLTAELCRAAEAANELRDAAGPAASGPGDAARFTAGSSTPA